MEEQITLEEIVVLARQLSVEDKVRLVEIMAPAIERETRADSPGQRVRRQAPLPDDYADIDPNSGETWRTFTYYEEN